MKRIRYIIIIMLLSILGKAQSPELPKYEGTQPVWQVIVKDELRGREPLFGLNIRTIVDDSGLYYSCSTDTINAIGNSVTSGYLLQKYDLSTGALIWSDQKEGNRNMDRYEHYDRLVKDSLGNIVLFGSRIAKQVLADNPWTHWLGSGHHFTTIRYDQETGAIKEKVISPDTILRPNPGNFTYNFLDIDRNLLLDNSLFGSNKFFGFRVVPYDENNRIDSTEIREFKYYMKDTTSFIANPLFNYVRDGIMRVAVGGYHFRENHTSEYDYIKYYEIDYRDINDIKVIDSFDISGRLPELKTHPIQRFTYPEFADDVMFINQTHYTDGKHGSWIAWYDYDGNLLGSHDHVIIEGYEEIYWYFKNIIVDNRFYMFDFLPGTKKEAVMIELSPDFLPYEIGRIKCENYDITRWWNIDYDEKNHQVIITTILDDKYNYIAAFDAKELGINQTSGLEADIVRQDYSIYPNPVTQSITLDIGEELFEGAVQIYDESGRIVYMKYIDFEGLQSIKVEDLGTGIYNLKLLSKDRAYKTKSFVKVE